MGIFGNLFRRSNKQQALLLNRQGIDLARKKHFKEPQQMFERAIAMAPDLPHPRICLSNLLLREGRYSQAEFQLKKALVLNPDNKTRQDALTNLSNIYFAQKYYSKAIELLKEATSIYRPDDEIYYNMGIAFEQLGEWEEALSYLKQSNDIVPNQKTQTSIKHVEQKMWRSSEMELIIDSYGKFDSEYPECKDGCLAIHELEKLESVISPDDRLVFFIGAGISFPYPSCLPMASQILRQVFHFIFELDKQDICEILQVSAEITEAEAYARLCRDLLLIHDEVPDNRCFLPFEPTFQALHDVLGFPVIRFVDLLNQGKPNLHHKMLAYALRKGHTVITTNFDKNIENAYMDFSTEESLQVLVTDKEYQESLDKGQPDGVLAKIHGDMADYNSLALTLQGVSVSCDGSIYLGDDIDKEKGRKQLQWIHPRTALSIPKALFLQRVLADKKIIVMGYSGSDTFDIMPILNTNEFNCRGLWIEHTNDELSAEIEKWQKNNNNHRIVLKPNSKEEERQDITSKASMYFLALFDGVRQKNYDITECYKSLTDAFKCWIDSLRLRPGNGLCCLARLYSQRGRWDRAKLLYSKAMKKYKNDIEHNELYWLSTKSNLGYILDNLDQEKQALITFIDIKEYLENKEKYKLYPHIYANTLIDIAGKWINTYKDNDAGEMVNTAMKIAEEIEDKGIMCYGLRLTADRYFKKKKYKEAVDLFLTVSQWSTDVFGDTRQACLSSMKAALCFAKLGAQYEALRMISHAEVYAKRLGDTELLNAVEHNHGYILGRFMGTSPVLNLHAELIEAARKQIGYSENIDELMQYIGFGQYDRALSWIDELSNRHNHPDIQAWLLFTKSNIYHRMQKLQEEIEILKQLCQVKPQFPLAEHNFGVAYSMLKNYSMAEKHLLKAINLVNGNYPLAICNLGMVYADTGRLEAARKQLLIAENSDTPVNSLEALRRHITETEKIKVTRQEKDTSMNNFFFPRKSPPTLGGIVFNILMLTAPFIGFLLRGSLGLLVGMSVACIGWSWFFFIYGKRGMRCQNCGRPVINLGRGSPLADSMNMGTFISVSAMRTGQEGPGDECRRCGRIYCTNCTQIDMTCICGSRNFRTVRLRYK